MSSGSNPRDEVELEAFLVRKSSLATDYDRLELVEPPAVLDAAILATAKFSAKPDRRAAEPATKPVPAATVTPLPARATARPVLPRPPIVETDDDEAAPPFRRPRWLVPAAVAAAVLVAVGVGVNMLGDLSPGTDDTLFDGSKFAKLARDRRDAEKAESAAAAADAVQGDEVLAPDAEAALQPPVFEAEGPRVQDFDAAIALIRKELLRANQSVAAAEDAKLASLAAPEQGARAAPATANAPVTMLGVVQPRERRLTKILELYDGGQQDLAADSLEIFLRDFEDDPISQRILAIQR